MQVKKTWPCVWMPLGPQYLFAIVDKPCHHKHGDLCQAKYIAKRKAQNSKYTRILQESMAAILHLHGTGSKTC